MDKVTVGGSGREAESRMESGPLPAFNRLSVGLQGAGHNLDSDLGSFQ